MPRLPPPIPADPAAGRAIASGHPGRRRQRWWSPLAPLPLLSLLLFGPALNGHDPLAAAPLPAPPGAPSPPGPADELPPRSAGAPPRMSEADFQAELRRDRLDSLDALCLRHAVQGDSERLAQLRRHLLARPMDPITLPRVLATAEVLLSCRAPAAALVVLDRISPDRGAGRMQWLLLQWRAANANLDHRLAARALERITAGQAERLAATQLPLRRPRNPGTRPPQRAAIDLLAADLEARGRLREAAERLLSVARSAPNGADPAALRRNAERLQWAVSLLAHLPAAERESLLEPALEQAAAAGAWGLVSEMLDQQLALDSPRAVERRLRLSPRLDDAYGEWRLRQRDPAGQQRLQLLEALLRSPRGPGGHADETAAGATSRSPAEPRGGAAPAAADPAARPAAASPARP
ncbi:MAG: hypothetical protein VKK62_01235 [Synechococcaceae cyanobacterium]|nr:hypothetical protein [Synechococcaceae cyanobacterium]